MWPRQAKTQHYAVCMEDLFATLWCIGPTLLTDITAYRATALSSPCNDAVAAAVYGAVTALWPVKALGLQERQGAMFDSPIVTFVSVE